MSNKVSQQKLALVQKRWPFACGCWNQNTMGNIKDAKFYTEQVDDHKLVLFCDALVEICKTQKFVFDSTQRCWIAS